MLTALALLAVAVGAQDAELIMGDCIITQPSGTRLLMLSDNCTFAAANAILGGAGERNLDLLSEVRALRAEVEALKALAISPPPTSPPPLVPPSPPSTPPPQPMVGAAYSVFEFYHPVSGSIWDTQESTKGWNLQSSGHFVLLSDVVERAYSNLQWYYTYSQPRGCSVTVEGRNGAPGSGYCATQSTSPCRADMGPSYTELWEPVASGELSASNVGVYNLQNQVIHPSYQGTAFRNWRITWTGNTVNGHGPLVGWMRVLEP